MIPSWYISVAVGLIEPGRAPPMSSAWPKELVNPISRPSKKIGFVTVTSGRWPTPPSER